MFKRLKQAMDDVLDKLEDRMDLSEDDVDKILRAMREELVDTKARTPELETTLAGLKARQVGERNDIEQCVRRASRAEEIADLETMKVAVEFAEKHKARLKVIEQRIGSTEADLALNRSEVAEMTAQLKEAMARRDALGAQSRRAKAMGGPGGAARDLIDQFDRMVERTERGSDLADAERALDREMSGDDLDLDIERARPDFDPAVKEADADRMLRELKRRMGMDEDSS